MKTSKVNLLLIGGSMVVLLIYIFAVDGPANLWAALRSVRPQWLVAGLLLMLVFWLLEANILHLGLRRFYPQQSFGLSFRTSMIGQFFNCVTPFASGGQPMQACHLSHSGVDIGVSAGVLLVKFIVYELVVTLYSLVTLALRLGELSARVGSLKYLVFFGLLYNTVMMAGLLWLCFGRSTGRMGDWIIRFLARHGLVKDPQGRLEQLHKGLATFREGAALMGRSPLLVVRMALVNTLQMTAYFLIPYVLLLAFGARPDSVLSVIAAMALVNSITAFVPLPGAAGGAELSFHLVFAMFFPHSTLNLAILLWRLLTFYLPICAGAPFVLRFGRRDKAALGTSAEAA